MTVSEVMLMLLLAGTLSSILSLTSSFISDSVATLYDGTAEGRESSRRNLAGFSSAEPSAQWNKTYGGAAVEGAYRVVQTLDSGFALVGETDSFGAGYADCWLVKTDADGSVQWNVTFGGSENDFGYCLIQTSDGEYAIAGTTASFGVEGFDFWLVKAGLSGGMEWNRTFGGVKDEVAWSLVQAADGGYVMAGSTDSFGGGYDDVWLVKTDASGNMLWNRTFGGGFPEAAYSILQSSDGGYVLAGYTSSSGAGSSDFWLIKIDAGGNIQWSRTYGGISWDCAYAAIQTGDGGYAITGHTRSFGVGGDLWLVKTDEAGRMQWAFVYGGASAESAYSIVQNEVDEYVIAGSTSSFGSGKEDFWLVKTDSIGNMLWNATFGGAETDIARSVVHISNDQFAMAGYTRSFGAGLSDFWLVKAGSWHDVAVVAVEPSQTIVEQGSVVNVNVTVQNQGNYPETFNVTVCADSIAVANQEISDLVPTANLTISLEWNTTAFALGTYTVGATASIVLGEIDTADNTCLDGSVRVAGTPTAEFAHWPEFPQPNSPVIFNATPSTPNGGTIIDYIWDFGDANETSTTDPIMVHVYVSSGNYNVTLEVIDDEGLVDMTWKQIPVYTHDLAVISINPSKTVVGQGYSVRINVTVENEGDTAERVNLTLYADVNTTSIGDELIIGNQTIYNFENRTLITTMFTWNTTNVGFGNYAIWAYAEPVLGETDTADNTFLGGWLCVSIPGDINADWKVDLKDVYAVAKAYGSYPGHERWDPACDIDGDLKVDLKDYYIACRNHGKTFP